METSPFFGPIHISKGADICCGLIEKSIIGWLNSTGAVNRRTRTRTKVRITVIKRAPQLRVGDGDVESLSTRSLEERKCKVAGAARHLPCKVIRLCRRFTVIEHDNSVSAQIAAVHRSYGCGVPYCETIGDPVVQEHVSKHAAGAASHPNRSNIDSFIVSLRKRVPRTDKGDIVHLGFAQGCGREIELAVVQFNAAISRSVFASEGHSKLNAAGPTQLTVKIIVTAADSDEVFGIGAAAEPLERVVQALTRLKMLGHRSSPTTTPCDRIHFRVRLEFGARILHSHVAHRSAVVVGLVASIP